MRSTTAAATSDVKRFGLMLALVVTGLLASAAPAQAGDTRCTFFLVAGTHDNVVVPPGEVCDIGPAYVKGNIICKEASLCFMGFSGPVTARGSIKCEEGASCFMDDSTVHGSVTCEDCDALDLFASAVRGNVQSKNSSAGSVMSAMDIGGDVQFEGTGQFLDLVESTVGGDVQVGKTLLTALPAIILEGMHLRNNQIAGNVQVVETTASGHEIVGNSVEDNLQFFKNHGPSDIADNTIGGNLQCKENVPPPMGGGNAAKQKEDQCATL
jgi:hypothetical protein